MSFWIEIPDEDHHSSDPFIPDMESAVVDSPARVGWTVHSDMACYSYTRWVTIFRDCNNHLPSPIVPWL